MMPQLLSILHTIFVMGIVLGFMILIHEFGHFAAAKYFGVRVEVFSIGFGKRLLGFTKGETDYRISAIPLGGYVKMSGENPMDDRTGDPGEFLSHPRWQRFVVALAGPAMNIMLAVALLTGVYMVHYEYPAVLDEPAVVGWVNPNTPAEKAGIQRGDKIVRVEDIENPNWEQVEVKAQLSPNQPLKFGIERDGKVIGEDPGSGAARAQSIRRHRLGAARVHSVTLTLVEPGMPADKAGIKVGDQILTANGQDIPAPGSAHPAVEPHQRSASGNCGSPQRPETDLHGETGPRAGRRRARASLPDRRRQPSHQSGEAQFLGRAAALSIGQQEKLFPHP